MTSAGEQDQDDDVFNLLDQIVLGSHPKNRKRPLPADEDQSATQSRFHRRGSKVSKQSHSEDQSSPAVDDTGASRPTQSVSRAIASLPTSWLERARQRKVEQATLSAVVPAPSVTRSTRLGFISLNRLRDLTHQGPHESRVTSVGFVSPNLAYSTGVDKCVKLYSCNNNEFNLKHAVHIKSSPIYSACLSSNKSSLLCISDRQLLFSLDLDKRMVSKIPGVLGRVDGQAYKSVQACDGLLALLDDRGKIFLLDERTYKTVKIFSSGTNNKCLTMTDTKIYSGDDGGELFEWDLRIGRCSRRQVVEGSLGVRSICTTQNKRLMVGTTSGYISLYDLDDLVLLKSFGNLTFPSDVLAPSPHAAIALGGSTKYADTVRLFNVGETPFVYQNFPGETSRLKRITCATFSESDQWMAIGNDRGAVKLWRVPPSSQF